MTRQQPGGIPSHLRVAKVYYNNDVQAIQEEFEDVKGYGEGTAEEWRKGLVTKGKDAMADAARWEKWESQMRLGPDLAQVLREYDLASFPKYREELQGRSAAGVSGTPSPHVTTTDGKLTLFGVFPLSRHSVPHVIPLIRHDMPLSPPGDQIGVVRRWS